MAMHYEIHRGYRHGQRLTPAQRRSGLFAEEPVVLGRTLRKGTQPMLLTETQFQQNKTRLTQLLLAGTIEIYVVDDQKQPVRVDYRTLRGLSAPVAAPATPPSTPGVGTGPAAPASATGNEESKTEVGSSSSGPEGDDDEDQGAEKGADLDPESHDDVPPIQAQGTA